MKTWSLLSLPLALGLSAPGLAREAGWNKKLFQQLTAHPAFHTTLFDQQAFILEQGGSFYAAFAVVQSESYPLICAFAAPFEASIGAEPGAYIFKTSYVCDHRARLKPYEGYFEIKYPPCGGEVCANPAIGVGNLDIQPDFDLALDRLPSRLPVNIRGNFNGPFRPELPVAGSITLQP